jgi:hypothetical protein
MPGIRISWLRAQSGSAPDDLHVVLQLDVRARPERDRRREQARRGSGFFPAAMARAG